MATAKENTPSRRKVVQVAATQSAAGAPPMATGHTEEVEAPKMVTVIVPKAYTLIRDNHQTVNFPIGTQEMSEDDLNHWWSQAHGVTQYKPK